MTGKRPMRSLQSSCLHINREVHVLWLQHDVLLESGSAAATQVQDSRDLDSKMLLPLG